MRSILIIGLMLMFLQSVHAQATSEDALNAIHQAEQDVQEMKEVGFSTNSVEDSLIAAGNALERADFAELIKQNATGELADKARSALEGLNYEGFTYDGVLEHASDIAERKQQAYAISDSIRALEIKIENYKPQGIDTSEAERLLADARLAFEKEQYGEAEELLSRASSDIEDKKAERTKLNIAIKAGTSFLEKNKREILILLFVLAVSVLLVFARIKEMRTEDRLRRLKREESSLVELMKRAQKERFKEGKIPDFIYKLRMDKYNKRLNEVKETIPVLEAAAKKNRKRSA